MSLTSFDLLILLLWTLSVVRGTRLVNQDVITDWLRIAAVKLTGEHSALVYFLTCPWCVSFWLAIASAWWPLLALHLPLWPWPLLAFSASLVTGTWLSLLPEDDIEIEVEEDNGRKAESGNQA